MNCPTCGQAMIVLEVEQIEVDYCTGCRGIWLDAGELELLLEGTGEANTLLQSLAAAQSEEEKRKCPICHKKMDKVRAGGATDVIDRCPRNHGLWFDRGELQKVLKGQFDDEGRVKRLLGEMFCNDAGS